MRFKISNILPGVCLVISLCLYSGSAAQASPSLEGGHATLICLDCHLYEPDPALDTVDTVTFVTATINDLCVSCHETKPLREFTNSPIEVQHNAFPVVSAEMYTFYTNWLATYNEENGTSLQGFNFRTYPDGTASLDCFRCHNTRGGPIYPDIPMGNAEFCVACHGGQGNYDPGVTQGVKSSGPRILYNPVLLGITDLDGAEIPSPWDPAYDGQPPADGNTVSERVPLPVAFFRKFHENIVQELNYRVDITGMQSDFYVEIDPRPMTWYTGIDGVARWLEEKPMYFWDTTAWPGDTYQVGLTPFNPLNPDVAGLPFVMNLIVEADLTPLELIEQIINIVESLNLQAGIANSLDAKLDAATQALDDVNLNNDVAAVNALNAFINAALAQRGNKIPEADADEIIALAQAAIAALEGS